MVSPLSNFMTINVIFAPTVARTPVGGSLESTAGITDSSATTVSSLARQLNEAALRADIRDTTLDQQALKEKAQALVSELLGTSYLANKAMHDGEVPPTSDPELLARARQATDFLNDSANVRNPFENLSREQLSLIVYDESNAFTVNERRAALQAAQEQEQTWRQANAYQGQAEYEASGKVTGALKDALEHYRSLPAIERAQYPENFQGDLIAKIIWSMEDEPVKPLETLLTLWDSVPDLTDGKGSLSHSQASSAADETGLASAESVLPVEAG